MNNIILDIIKSFKTNSKIKNFKFKDFLVYVYETFEEKIKLSKSQKIKDKYKKMRLNILKYIIENEKEIVSRIF